MEMAHVIDPDSASWRARIEAVDDDDPEGPGR
jgi:hypothetical protein